MKVWTKILGLVAFLGLLLVLFCVAQSIQSPTRFVPKDYSHCVTRDHPSDFEKLPLKIVYHRGWFPAGWTKLNCGVPCMVTSDRTPEKYKVSDAYSRNGQPLPERSCPHQQRIYDTWENHHNEEKEWEISNFPSTYSHILVSYWGNGFDIYAPVPVKNKIGLACAFISNCEHVDAQQRIQYIEELLKAGLKIDLYGPCFPGRNKPEKYMEIKDRDARKIRIMQDYKFYLAFENSMASGYVSEKFWQGFVAGTIPVVRGDPEIEHFEPYPGSVVNTARFETPEALVKRIYEISHDEKLYDSYFEYKNKPPTKQFLSFLLYQVMDGVCKVCTRVADGIVPQWNPNAVMIREYHTWQYKILNLRDRTVESLHEAIYNLFKKPVWSGNQVFGKKYNGANFEIWRIGFAESNYQDIMFGYNLDSNEKIELLNPGDKLEVLFVPKSQQGW